MNEFTLRLLYEVSSEGSFSKAAASMFISQPAATKQIRAVEKELGLRLFDRSASGVTLTKGGQVFLRHASGILSQYRKMRNEISLLSEQLTGSLTIGASTTIAQYLIGSYNF